MRLTKPLPGVRLNRAHQLGQGYFAGWLLNEGSGAFVADLGGRFHAAITDVSVTRGVTDRGPALTGVATASATRGVELVPVISLPVPYTWVAHIRHTAGDTYASLLTNSTSYGIYVNTVGATSKIDYTYSGADHRNTTPLTGNVWTSLGITATVAGALVFYLNGLADGTATSAPTLLAREMFNDTFSETFKGDILYQHLWSRALTANEILWLHTEPYAFLAPPGPARWYSVGAVTAGHPAMRRLGGVPGVTPRLIGAPGVQVF